MRLIQLTRSHVTSVDDVDYDMLSRHSWSAYVDQRGKVYAVRGVRVGNAVATIRMHRQLMGVYDPDVQVDHKDGDSLNNQKWNLRPCSNAQNSHNRPKRKDSGQPFKGIEYHHGAWRVRIRFNGRRMTIGGFATQHAAASAYNEKSMELFGEFAYCQCGGAAPTSSGLGYQRSSHVVLGGLSRTNPVGGGLEVRR